MSLPFATRLGLAAALGSAALLGGAYYFQYVVGLAPCEMCLWQRYPHMVVILFGLITVPLMSEPKVAMVFALSTIVALLVTSGLGVYSSSNRPFGNGWAYTATNTTGANSEVTVYALCLAG